jgi:hypothetical protein
VWIGPAIDAFGGEGLDVARDAVLEGNAVVEGIELVNVVMIDGERIGEVDGEDTNALGSWCDRWLVCGSM